MPPSRPQLAIVPGTAAAASVSDDEPTDDFAALFRRFAPYVGRIALSVLGAADEVEDVVQEVFVTAHRHLGTIRDRGATKAWLSRIAVREAARRLRRRRVKRILGVGRDVAESPHLADHGTTPEQRALLLSIYRALDRLPTPERLAWTLRRVEGERLEAVAQLCGCSLATAKRRIASADERIRRFTGESVAPTEEQGDD